MPLPHPPGRRVTSAPAFTLLEIIVVVAVIAILIAFAGPAIQSLSSPKLRTAVRESAAVFEKARSMARAQGVPVRVLILQRGAGGDALALAVERDDASGWEIVDSIEPLPDGVVFDLSQPGVPEQSVDIRVGSGETLPARYYQIAANGTCSGTGRNFVVGIGSSSADGSGITDAKEVDGFRITAAARPFFFRSADEIGRELSPVDDP